MHPFEVLLRPLITEKSTRLQEAHKYAFQVASQANKAQVKEAVQRAFNVHVISVNVMTVHGKRKRFGPRLVSTGGWKKAVVTLRPDEKIEIFEGA